MRANQAALAAFGFATMPHRVVASNGQQASPLSQRDVAPQWKALGCYVDKQALQNLTTKASRTFLTIGNCEEACFSDGFQYAGVQVNQCWCGTHVGSSRTENQEDCDIPCPGYSLDICGGLDAINIFEAQTGGTSTARPAPTGSSSSGTISTSTASLAAASSTTANTTTPTSQTASTTSSSQATATGGAEGQKSGSRGMHSVSQGLTWLAAGLVWLVLEL